MKILVCGGRNYQDKRATFAALDRAHAKRPIRLVIHGDADGADTLAKMWAQLRGIPDHPFPADWPNITLPGAVVRKRRDGVEYDAMAVHVRNQRMSDEGRPDGVLALPRGTGTADMVRRAEAAGLPVWRPSG